VSDRNYQIDMSNSLSTYFFLCHFNTTTVTNDTLITDSLILSAGTFVILHRSEYFLAEQTVPFRLVGVFVTCFGLHDLSPLFLQDRVGRCKTDGDFIKST